MTHDASGAPDRGGLRALRILLLAAVAAVSLLYLVRPIRDLDFFWHLKTGEWIWQQRALPAGDPFSPAGEVVVTPAVRHTLTSYWAAQLLFFGAHALGGMSAIVLLRALLVAGLLAVVWQRRRGDPVVDAALLLVFALFFLEKYPLERPQVLSFLALGALLALLDQLRCRGAEQPPRPSPLRGWRGPLLLALLMLAWANVHGGFILGQAAIAVVLAAEGAKFAHPALRPAGREAYRALALAAGAGLAASLANPNGLEAWRAVLPSQIEWKGLMVTEYASMVQAFTLNQERSLLLIWLLMLLAAVAVAVPPRRIDITEAMLVAGSGYYAFRHLRFVPVFLIVALPAIGRFLSQGGRARAARAVLIAGALALALVFARDERGGLARLHSGEWVSRDEFPVAAADFILARGLPGTVYNFFDWGGYLVWRLAPARPVFVDGRGLVPGKYWQASVVRMGFELPGPENWRSILARHGVGVVVVPAEYQGKRFPIVDRLRADPEWAAVFAEDNSLVFARRPAPPRGGPPP